MIDDCAQLLAASVFFSQVGDEPVNIFLVLTVNIFELVGIRYGHYSAIMQKNAIDGVLTYHLFGGSGSEKDVVILLKMAFCLRNFTKP